MTLDFSESESLCIRSTNRCIKSGTETSDGTFESAPFESDDEERVRCK